MAKTYKNGLPKHLMPLKNRPLSTRRDDDNVHRPMLPGTTLAHPHQPSKLSRRGYPQDWYATTATKGQNMKTRGPPKDKPEGQTKGNYNQTQRILVCYTFTKQYIHMFSFMLLYFSLQLLNSLIT